MPLSDSQSNAISGAASSLLGAGASIAGGFMSRKQNEVAARKQFEYNATLQNEAAAQNREAMAQQHGYNVEMAGINQANAMAMLNAQQDYNTKFAYNSQKMQANALRGAGLNPAAASGQLLQPGVSGPSPGSGQGSSAVGVGAASTGLIADPMANGMNAAGSLLGSSVLNITQSLKNLKDAGKSGSEKELNEIESKYRDQALQQQIIGQSLQNRILDYEAAFKIQTYDENVKAVILSNIETMANIELTQSQQDECQAKIKQLTAAADNLDAQTKRINQLLPAEKQELFSRAANNAAQAALAREMGTTEANKRAWYDQQIKESKQHAVLENKEAYLLDFEKRVKDAVGVSNYKDLELNNIDMSNLALHWFNTQATAEVVGMYLKGLGSALQGTGSVMSAGAKR